MPRRSFALPPAALLVLALSACSAGAPSTSPPLPTTGPDPGVVHVHGLDVDPADRVLYAASHYGLFRIPDQGTATRVADRFQDTMGFTVVGPNTFLGSGHPDFQKDPDLPPRLGLIRSTDAAESWQSVSLAGKSDFHVLHAAHGNVYGWDATSSSFMVSGDDGFSWDTRSQLGMRDFAVSPAEPDTLLATTEQALLRSSDGGRTWQAAPGSPLLVVLAWAEEDSLIGIAAEGTVQHSRDGGRTWVARGSVAGQPEAVTVDSRGTASTLYVAVMDHGIVASSDGGATFTTRYAE